MDENLTEVVMVLFLGAVLHEHLLDIGHGGRVVIGIVVLSEQLLIFVASSSIDLIKLILVSVVLLAAADVGARDGAKHNGQEDESDVDEHVGDVLLTREPLRPIIVRGGETSNAHDIIDDDDNDGRRS